MTMGPQDTSRPGSREDLEKHLRAVLLPAAVEWLLMLWDVTQVFDDYADGDPVARDDLYKAIWDTLVGMPSNAFYAANQHVLSPMLALMVLKWRAANTAEATGKASEQSYMWRAEYYGIVLMCVQLQHGPKAAAEAADKVLGLYGETYASYSAEFRLNPIREEDA